MRQRLYQRTLLKALTAQAYLLQFHVERHASLGDNKMVTVSDSICLAAVGDIHCGRNSQGVFNQLFAQANDAADVLLLCGDLTDYGLPEEAEILAREITSFL